MRTTLKKLTEGNGLEKAIYESIDKTYLILNEAELNMVARQLKISLQRYHEAALQVPEVRHELYRWYNERVKADLTTSVFAAGFNMAVKDNNKRLMEKVDSAFIGASNSDLRGSPANAASVLIGLGMRNQVMFNPRIVQLVQKHSPNGCVELTRIEQYRMTMFRCVMPLAAERARMASDTNGSAVSYPDMVQEAFIAVIQALEGYEPVAGGKTLTTFIYTSVAGVLAKRKAELSRTVRIPRMLYERFTQVLEATNELYISDFFQNPLDFYEAELIVEQLNKKPSARGLFTMLELVELHRIMQPESHFDKEFFDTREDAPASYQSADCTGQQAVEESYDMEAEYDARLARERLLKLMDPFCTGNEHEILAIRWGMDDVKSYIATADIYHDRTGRPMNKTTVSQIEANVFQKIRAAAEKDVKLKGSFMQIWESLRT
jgi:DNA-directed RNA polymerase sigma subunit (sigma70/sigma32)